MKAVKKSELDGFVVQELEIILAEKRTALSTLRTGIAVFALPLTVLSALVATSRYYDALHVVGYLVVLLLLNVGLVALGTYLIVHAIKKIRHYDALIREIKIKHSALAEFVE